MLFASLSVHASIHQMLSLVVVVVRVVICAHFIHFPIACNMRFDVHEHYWNRARASGTCQRSVCAYQSVSVVELKGSKWIDRALQISPD